jgi:hypothetical protein
VEPPRRRALLPRDREPPLRDREDVLRGFAAPADFFAAGLRAVDERLLPPPDDLARDALDFFAVLRLAVDRLADDLRAPLDFFAAPPRLEPEDDEPELALALPSIDHWPVMTRGAASATASAISEPNLVALAMTLVAACDAVSAASSPASRIARRAFGLALIAAAAAARPAASISLLIAALASLSTVSLLFFEVDPEVLLRADLAIALFLRSRKDTSRL